MRNYRGFEYNSGYPDVELTLDKIKHIFSAEFLEQLRPRPIPVRTGVTFNGNLGDFALARDAASIVDYMLQHGVQVNINTNGSLRSPTWWASLAKPGVEIGFALDGLEDTHHLYRQDTSWKRVIENATAFIKAGGRAVWRFIPFDHNRHQEQQCRQMAQELGFARFENIYDGRDTGPVFTRQGVFSHQLGQDPSQAKPDVHFLLRGHRTWFNHRTIKIAKDKPDLEITCIHKRNREIYLAADGSVYPCCFLGFYPDTMQHPGNEQTRDLMCRNNALQYPLEQCLEWFDSIEQTWQQPSIAEGRLYQCVSSCGKA